MMTMAQEASTATPKDLFNRFAKTFTEWAGNPLATLLAFMLVFTWIGGGLFVGYGTDYQMYINTGTTIVTFLMVFLIQNTQNRDAKAMHLKLDELLRAVKGARTELVDLEDLTDEELDTLQQEFKDLQQSMRAKIGERAAELRQSRHPEPPDRTNR
jgi:low affinity Fe/Cu permease